MDSLKKAIKKQLEKEATYVKVQVSDSDKELQHFYPKASKWGLPAGIVEKGESLREAAARELLERTGYKVNPSDLVEKGMSGQHKLFSTTKDKLRRIGYPGQYGNYKTKVRWEKKAEFAPGIPSNKPMAAIPTSDKPFRTNWVVQFHKAKRAGPHYDLRLNLGGRAFSWAVPKWPGMGEKRLAIRQFDHKVEYMSFKGKLPKGYGEGTVSIYKSGQVQIIYSNPKHIKFVYISSSSPIEYNLIHTGGKNWILYNTSKKRSETVPDYKSSYKKVKETDLEKYMTNKRYTMEPKIDGAHNLLVMEKNKQPRVFSYRKSKKSETGLIDHTWKFPELLGKKTPKGTEGIYRGEVYATHRGGQPTSVYDLAGILNSNSDNALDLIKRKNIKLRMAVFGKHGDESIDKKKDNINKVVKEMGSPFEHIERAETEVDKRQMLKRIREKTHDKTKEGIIIVDNKTGAPMKFKFRPDYDVFIRRFFEGAGKYKGNAIGGFYYSITPHGPVVGKVGTGFSDKQRRDMFSEPNKYKGRVATLYAMGRNKSGALREPSFVRMHLDK
jgi:DNA ligase D-like protein (predicted 3'-phosphoesterase)